MPGGWLQSSLNRKLGVALLATLALASVICLGVFVTLYQSVLTRERGDATAGLNRLLQVTLENAMLKRDLAGLRDVVDRLGQQPGVRGVMITDMKGEVRFASTASRLGSRLSLADLGCPECGQAGELTAPRQFTARIDGVASLRSVNPIPNRAACAECHGDARRSPINGVLIVDQDGTSIERDAVRAAALFTGAGGVVALATALATGWFVRRHVVAPVVALSEVSRRLSEGDQGVRATIDGGDEISQLGLCFNDMANRIGATMSELGDSREFLQTIIDTLPDGLRIIGADHEVVLVNKAYCEQTGLDAGHVGQPCYVVHGQSAPCPATLFNCPLVELAVAPGPMKYVQRHARPDGREVVTELVAAAVTTRRAGKSKRLVIESFRDLSRHIRYSQEQRLAEIGQLATGVAHEIRNPLSSVKLGLEAMLRNLNAGRTDPTTFLNYLKLVGGEVDKCIEVTGRLLRLGMPPSEHLQLLSLARIVDEVLSLLRYEAETMHVEVRVEMPTESLRVLATDSELRMLVLNLTQNAFHAMPNGGSLVVRGSQVAERITLEFEDTGVGIAPDVLPRIFDPFYSCRADGEQGTGLGLTICKAIVARYHGTIDVRSVVSKGTTFSVTLPVAALEVGT